MKPTNMNNNNNSDNSRRSALKKIAATSGLLLGLPLLTKGVMWANPTSGIVDKVEDKETLAPLFAYATTCIMITTNSTTRPLFATFGSVTTTPAP